MSLLGRPTSRASSAGLTVAYRRRPRASYSNLMHCGRYEQPVHKHRYSAVARTLQVYSVRPELGIGQLETSLNELLARFKQPQVRYRPGLSTFWRSYRATFNRVYCVGRY